MISNYDIAFTQGNQARHVRQLKFYATEASNLQQFALPVHEEAFGAFDIAS